MTLPDLWIENKVAWEEGKGVMPPQKYFCCYFYLEKNCG